MCILVADLDLGKVPGGPAVPWRIGGLCHVLKFVFDYFNNIGVSNPNLLVTEAMATP